MPLYHNSTTVIRVYDTETCELLITFRNDFEGFTEWLRNDWDGQNLDLEQEIEMEQE